MKIRLLLLLTALQFCGVIYGQSERKSEYPFNEISPASLHKANAMDFYPLEDGDFWEYIQRDTVTMFPNTRFENLTELNFSVIKEVLGDTLMPNGKTYKKIKWEHVSNSVSKAPWYDYHRKDTSGNVYMYYGGADYLLYDFTKAIGETYPSHISGWNWKVKDKQTVTGFGMSLHTVEFSLDSIGWEKDYRITIENFGLSRYGYDLPYGNMWGAVLGGTEYGYLIAKKQQIDWSKFYPLHVGDFWIYEGFSGQFPYTSVKRITKDTVMADGNKYYGGGSLYERVDSSGNIFYWDKSQNSAVNTITFSSVIGDTFYVSDPDFFYRTNNKEFYNGHFEIYRFLYPDLIFSGEYYAEGLGFVEWTIEGGGGILVGAYINGEVWGDTTIGVEEEAPVLNDFSLEQNYPNPFNPVTQIEFSLNKSGKVKLQIYSILGELVKTIVDGELKAGYHKYTWNGTDGNNVKVSSGVYVYRLITDQKALSKKMVLLK